MAGFADPCARVGNSTGQAVPQGSPDSNGTLQQPDGSPHGGRRRERFRAASAPPPTHPDSRYYGTTELPNTVEKIAGSVQDKLKKE